MLRDKLNETLSPEAAHASSRSRRLQLAAEEDMFFSTGYLLNVLLRAIASEKPVVLLIDEIDRADAEFEAFCSKCFERFSGLRAGTRHS